MLEAMSGYLSTHLPVDEWAARLGEQPARNTVALVGIASVLFYAAEREKNKNVDDIWDALVYCTTNLSVGYCDIFAQTTVGKIVGSALMTVGPALAARMLDGPAASKPDPKEAEAAQTQRDRLQRETLETLRQILARLESASPPASL